MERDQAGQLLTVAGRQVSAALKRWQGKSRGAAGGTNARPHHVLLVRLPGVEVSATVRDLHTHFFLSCK